MKKTYNFNCVVPSILILLLLGIYFGPIFSVSANDNYYVTKDWIIDNLENDNVVFLDARSFDEYRGVTVEADRGGHIPGAINIEWTYCFDFNGTYKSTDELLMIFETAGVTKNNIVVAYCHIGQRAETLYNTLIMLNYSQVFVYDGSWNEWGNDPTTPVETICTLALTSGPKNNTDVTSCSCSTKPYTGLTYSYVSELTGQDWHLARAEALSNSEVQQITANFTHMHFSPKINESNATRVLYETDDGTFNETTLVVIPFKPRTPRNENVTLVEIVYNSETAAVGGVSEEIIDEKTWTTYYWVNQTTNCIDTLLVDPCDYWCLATCILQEPEIWAQCAVACWCATSVPPLCGTLCLVCVLALGGLSTICTIPCGCWEPPQVTIRVETSPINDGYSRYHGVSLDEYLATSFWTVEPGKIIQTTAGAFSWQQTYTLDSGSHSFVYSVSCYWSDYYWNAQIYVDDQLVAQGDVGYNHQLVANFSV